MYRVQAGKAFGQMQLIETFFNEVVRQTPHDAKAALVIPRFAGGS